jgi:type II secretory pathway component GspD/PulD (secretin)
MMVKQSRQSGTFNAIPIEAKRTTDTTLRMKTGQTIFIGGLRRFDDGKQATKVPILGDIPVMNLLFRNNIVKKTSTELLVFLTCNIMPEEMPALGADLQKAHDELETFPRAPNAQHELGKTTLMPYKREDPNWRWRRSE